MISSLSRVTVESDRELIDIPCPTCDHPITLLRSPTGFGSSNETVECQECDTVFRTYRNGNVSSVVEAGSMEE